jgi:membrane protein YdbS with pleckstrin-like domain
MTYWPYTVLEKSRVYQWIRTIVLAIGAPGLGVWLLATRQCEKWQQYAAAISVLLIGLIVWGSFFVAVVRRVRTGKWMPEEQQE